MTDEDEKKPNALQYQNQLRNPTSPGVKKTSGMGFMAIFLWLAVIGGVGILILIGLVVFTCSR